MARLLNLRRIRRQPLRVAISIVAIAAGVSLAVGVLILNSSTRKSIDEFARTLAGPTELRVIGATTRGGLDERVVAKVDAVEGIKSAVPIVQAVAYIDTGRGGTATAVVLGIDCRVEQLLGDFGCDDATMAAAIGAPPVIGRALAARLAPGAQIVTDVGRRPIDPALAVPQLDELNGGNVVVYPMRAAQNLFARAGRLDAIYVTPQPGVDVLDLQRRIQQDVGGWNAVLRADQPPPGADAVAAALLLPFGMLSLIALAIGALLIYNTLSLSLEERRRDLAVVGALGARSRTIIGGVLLEAGVFGLAGGLVGTLGGALIAGPMVSSISDFTRKFMGVPVAVSVSPGIVILGACLGALVGVAAAWIPARRATRLDVAAELSLRDRRAETARRARVGRLIVFSALTLVGIGLCWLSQDDGALRPWQPGLAPVGVVVVSAGALLAAGSAAPIVARLAQRSGGADGAIRLGLANLVREPGRTSVMTIAIAAAVGMGLLISSTHESIHDAIAAGVAAESPRELTAYRVNPNNTLNVDGKVDAVLIERLRAIPGVASISRSAGVGLRYGTNLMGVVGRDVTPLGGIDLIKGTNDREHFDRGNVMVGAALARDEGLRPGSRLRLDTPTGYAHVTVGGIWQNGNFTGRAVNMPWHLFVRLYGDEPPFSIGVTPADGVGVDELAQRIRALDLDPDLEIVTPAESIEEDTAEIKELLAPFEAVQRSMFLIAFIAVLSTLLLVGVQRRRELGLLAAVGMEPRQLARMTLAEGIGMSVIAVLLAGLVGSAMNVGFTLIVPVLIGFKDPLRFDLGSLLLSSLIAVAVVTLAAAFPAWRTSRVEVLEALQYE